MNEQEALKCMIQNAPWGDCDDGPQERIERQTHMEALSVLRAAVEERDKLKGEVEMLLKQLAQETDESDMWRTKAEKAEGEATRWKLAAQAEVTKRCDAIDRAEKAEAELEKARKQIRRLEKAIDETGRLDTERIRAYRAKVEKKEKA